MRRTHAGGLILATIVALIAGSTYLVKSGTRSHSEIPASTRDSEGEPGSTGSPTVRAPESASTTLAAPTETGSEREPLESSGLTATLSSTSGEALSGVEALWILEPDSIRDVELDLLHEQWAERRAEALLARSDGEGKLGFAWPKQDELPPSSFLALHEPSHGLSWWPVGTPPNLGRVELNPSPPVVVRVERSDGSPAARASVRVLARPRTSEEGTAVEAPGPPAALLLSTSDDGTAELGRFDGEAAISAELGEFRTGLWVGNPETSDGIQLTLGSTRVASGSVLPDSVRDITGLELHVTASHRADDETRPLRSTQVGPDRRWSMEELPTYESGTYVFRVRGEGIVPEEVTVPATGVGPIQVDLPVRIGAAFEVRVRDHEQNPLPAVDVGVRWDDPKAAIRATSRTGEKGAAWVEAVQRGDVWITLSAAGHLTATVGPLSTEALEDAGTDLYLGRAGRLRVQCDRAGEAVREYSLRYWEGVPHEVFEKQVVADESGAVILSDAPLGEVFVLAFDDLSPGSEIASVSVTPDEQAEVHIELFEPGTASGTVVDAETGMPVPESTVQVHALQGGSPVGACGESMAVGASGKFEGVAVPRALFWLDVQAPGYGPGGVEGRPDSFGFFDAGQIALSPSRTFEVRLVGQPGQDLSDHMVQLHTNRDYPRVQCSSDGRASFEGVGTGSTTISIWPPELGRQSLQFMLHAGDPWYYEIPIDTDRTLGVQVHPAGGQEIVEGMFVGATFRTSRGDSTARDRRLPLDGRVEFPNVTGKDVVVQIWSPDFQVLGAKHVEMAPAGITEAGIELADGARRIRFVDTNYDPITGAAIELKMASLMEMWLVNYRTDGEGMIEILGMSELELVATVHLEGASAIAIPIELDPDPAAETLVQVDVGATMNVTILDGSLPLDGASMTLASSRGAFPFELLDADPSGRIQFGSMSPNTYHAEIRGKGLWTTDTSVTASHENPTHEVQVRRIGSVEFSVEGVGGPLPGAAIELVSREFAESAATWLASGRIQSSTDSMQSDADGRLLLHGLPHGRYSWTAVAPAGSSSEGEFLLLPGEVVRQAVRL